MKIVADSSSIPIAKGKGPHTLAHPEAPESSRSTSTQDFGVLNAPSSEQLSSEDFGLVDHDQLVETLEGTLPVRSKKK